MNINIERLRETKTPCYYYDMELLRQTIEEVKRQAAHYGCFEVHYAVKANANPKILKTIVDKGLGADCVSGGEVRAALAAGCPASKIVFAGVGKADWEIELALDNDIFCFNVESIPELEVINELAAKREKKASVAFRINPNVDAHTHANITTGLAENKFGIAMEDMETVFARAAALPNIEVKGIHFHIGSQITEMEPFVALSHRINELQDRLEARGIHVQHVNVGGGLGIDYVTPDEHPIPDFAAYMKVFADHLKLRPNQTLHFELGRSIVAQCGAMISRVLYVKEAKIKKFTILDAGMTELIRPALYDAYHKAENLTSDEAVDIYDIVGPICESSDVFEKGATLNCTHRGDLIAFRSAGAYGEVMASGYNCRELPVGYTSDEWK